MPILHIHNAGPLSEAQRRQLTERLTAIVAEITSKPESSVYLRIDEVPRTHFAVGGRLLADRDRETAP